MMPRTPESEPTVDELMAGIRAILDHRDGGSRKAPSTISPQPSLDRAQLLLDQAEQVADVGSKVPPFTIFGPVRRAVARLIARGLLYFLQVISVDQRVFNGLLSSAVRSNNTALQHLTNHVLQLQDDLETLATKVDTQVAELAQSISSLRTSANLQQSRLAGLLAKEHNSDNGRARREASPQEPLWDALYADLEDRFRGTREDIKRRLESYLPIVRQAKAGQPDRPIVDLGCGRAEWLELLGEQGLAGRGVETNTVLAERGRTSGFEIVEQDAIAYLRDLPDRSIGAVTAFHLIEHLPLENLLALLDETLRVLRPGGLAIFETPNPANVQVGSCTFYLDPTHRHPLPSPLMKFLFEARGLCNVEIVPLHPYPAGQRIAGAEGAARFEDYFYGPQDYAVIGTKA